MSVSGSGGVAGGTLVQGFFGNPKAPSSVREAFSEGRALAQAALKRPLAVSSYSNTSAATGTSAQGF